MNNKEKLALLLAAINTAQRWYDTYGAVSIAHGYAQVTLDVFPDYCPDKAQWTLVKRHHTSSPYELRCVMDPATGFYLMALVFPHQIGFVRDTFGPNYAEIAISRHQIETDGKEIS